MGRPRRTASLLRYGYRVLVTFIATGFCLASSIKAEEVTCSISGVAPGFTTEQVIIAQPNLVLQKGLILYNCSRGMYKVYRTVTDLDLKVSMLSDQVYSVVGTELEVRSAGRTVKLARGETVEGLIATLGSPTTRDSNFLVWEFYDQPALKVVIQGSQADSFEVYDLRS